MFRGCIIGQWTKHKSGPNIKPGEWGERGIGGPHRGALKACVHVGSLIFFSRWHLAFNIPFYPHLQVDELAFQERSVPGGDVKDLDGLGAGGLHGTAQGQSRGEGSGCGSGSSGSSSSSAGGGGGGGGMCFRCCFDEGARCCQVGTKSWDSPSCSPFHRAVAVALGKRRRRRDHRRR